MSNKEIIIIAKAGDIWVYQDPKIAKAELKAYFDENADKEWSDLDHKDIDRFVENLGTIERSIEMLIDDNDDLTPIVITGRTYKIN